MNLIARNNLRAMKIGDLAFFSHSNCKEPGIVGIMEIVREHTPDRTSPTSYQPTTTPTLFFYPTLLIPLQAN